MEEAQYEANVLEEANRWVKQMEKKSSIIQRRSKHIQSLINKKVPDRVHSVVTESVKQMIQLALTSSKYIYKVEIKEDATLEERENMIKERLRQYKRTAALEGAGTGAGGILLGAADFPLLLSIKMKFLFDVGQLYGYDVTKYEERMYLLHLFILAFSSDEQKKSVLETVLHWEKEKLEWREVDWKTLQMEYRDTIDFVKMMQLIPGIGALVGAWGNYRLLEQLGETAMNGYRLRMLSS
ncbi:EcsC family protein [Pontibacillus yanchengensis]|uniref:EcsC n=1 Tax=Pontibacillus yanchengensis Y32 TaxID=1385514 RepID=A0A0A2T8Y6_9BACI|nr:EcsC family protein [Pontibacillus yanchengensis]KGP72272.1 ecsC [Pontibacillus yanchengensis Y32]